MAEAVPSPKETSVRERRLTEIDWFRALAICYMGITHGIFHLDTPPNWAKLLAIGGGFFCFPAFMIAFGMAQAIIAQRGSLSRPGGKRKMLRAALTILAGYYLIAIGGNLPLLKTMHVSTQVHFVLKMLLLLQVPKAGDFFLCFLVYLLAIVAWPKLTTWIMASPAKAMTLSLVVSAAGNLLGRWVPPALFSGWWTIVAGTIHDRCFPALGDLPFFTAGVWAGGEWLRSANRKQLAHEMLPLQLSLALIAGLACYFMSSFSPAWALPAGQSGWLQNFVQMQWANSPTPGIVYLFAITGTCLTAFFAFAWLVLHEKISAHSAVGRFLGYVGKNSFWVVVWQYLQIGILVDVLHQKFAGTALLPYLLLMLFLPPLLLWCTQKMQGMVFSRRPAPVAAGTD